jgi:exopolysaccharide biosynthesis WecB/TagA/CpsF family protein
VVDRRRRVERADPVHQARLVALGGEVMAVSHQQVTIAGTAVDLLTFSDAVNLLCARAANRTDRPLAVASINLDHIHHFGQGSRWADALDSAPSMVQWLNLLDGAPVVAAARKATGDQWPRLAGSDLIGPLLERAAGEGLSVGFLGGTEETHGRLRESLALNHPGLKVVGYWAPSRTELSDPSRSATIARSVELAGADILVVSLGKPRQELWISEYGHRTGARVILAFGAVVDFLAGRIHRAPGFVARAGMEWAWRLALEPRRLSRRYLVQGPAAFAKVRWPNAAARVTRARSAPPAVSDHPAPESPAESAAAVDPRADAGPGQQAPALLGSVIIPAHNEASVIARVLRPLAGFAASHRLQVVVVCNGCRDDTAVIARRFPGVDVIEAREASKAAALNAGDAVATAWPRLYLDADIELSAATVQAVLGSLGDGAALAARPASVYDTAGAGAIVRSYYRARSRVPSLHRGLWGAGAYALSRSGHERLGSFPDVTGDDFWVDQLFAPSEKVVVDTEPVIVHTPRDLPALIGILRRGHRGVTQAVVADARATTSTAQTLRGVALSVRGPRQLSDAAVYAALSVAARLGAVRRSGPVSWERDDSSR